MTKLSVHQRKARDFIQREDWSNAVVELERMLGADANNPTLHNQIGDVYLRKDEVGKAIEHFESAIDLYATVGLHNNAVALCKKIMRLRPARVEIRYRLAQLRLDQGFRSEAAAFFRDYLEHPNSGQDGAALEARCREMFEQAPEDAPIGLVLEKLEGAQRFVAAFEIVRTLAQRAADAGDDAGAQRYGEKMRSLRVLVERNGGRDLLADVQPPATGANAAAATTARTAYEPRVLSLGSDDAALSDAASPRAAGPGAFAQPSLDGIDLRARTLPTAAPGDELDAALGLETSAPGAADGAIPPEDALDLDFTPSFLGLGDDESVASDAPAPRPVDAADVTADAALDGDLVLPPGVRLLEPGPEDRFAGVRPVEPAEEFDLAGTDSTSFDDDALDLSDLDAGMPASTPFDLRHDTSPPEAFAIETPLPAGEDMDALDIAAVRPLPIATPSDDVAGASHFADLASALGSHPGAAFDAPPAPPARAGERRTPDPQPNPWHSADASQWDPASLAPATEAAPALAPAASIPPVTEWVDELRRSPVWIPTGDTLTGPDPLRPDRGLSMELESVIDSFREQMSRALDGDGTARYDLGVAYYDMGLYNEALAEFEAASLCPGLEVQSFEMLAQCLLQTGRHGEVLEVLLPIVAADGHAPRGKIGLQYCLGMAYEALGDFAHARRHYEEVALVDVDFKDVQDRLQRT